MYFVKQMTILPTTSSITIDLFELRSSKKLAKTSRKHFLNSILLVETDETKYSRMDQVQLVEDNL